MPVFNALNSGLQYLDLRNYKHPCVVKCEVYVDILNLVG